MKNTLKQIFNITVSLIAVALLGRAVLAQDPPPTITFQTEVTYVDVDTVVTDEKGNFISGLTKDEFEVFEDGKPQKVDTFTYVEIPLQKPDRFLIADRPVTTDTQSNRQHFAGRLYVIVLDDFNISVIRSAHVKKAARQFIDQYFGDNDLAAVIYTSGRTDAAQEFTSNRQLLYAAVDKFMGRRLQSLTIERLDAYYQQMALSSTGQSDSETQEPQSTDTGGHGRMTDPSDFERGYRAIATLDTLKNTAEFLSTVRGRRKAVLFFSEGIDYPITDMFGMQSASDVIRASQDAVTMAARSNVNYYTIDPRGLVGMTSEFMEMQGGGTPELMGAPRMGATGSPMPSMTGAPGGPFNATTELMMELQLSQGSLRTLADETGGIASVNSNSLTTAFERIVEANSRYYVLGYYPPTHPRDGRFHKIEVKVKRPGLKVLARRGYGSPRGRTVDERKRDEETRRIREAKRPNADKTSTELRAMLNNPMQQSGLTFSVQAAPFKNTPKEASVALAIEFDGDRIQVAPLNEKGVHANMIELSFFGIGGEGKAQQGVRSELELMVRPATYERIKAGGIRVNPRLALAPGRYQVRVGARSAFDGKTGTVYYDLEVPDFRKEKLMLSGLLLAAPSAEQIITIQPDAILGKMLPGAATSRRRFVQSDTLVLYAEIYDNLAAKQARQIDLAVKLLSESGGEVFAAKDSLSNGPSASAGAGAAAKPWEIYGYTKAIPLTSVAPGRYLLRLEAQVRGNIGDAKPVARETLITVVP